MAMIYLACPYSHRLPEVRERRFEAVTRYAGKLMHGGEIVYSPITHCHPIAEACGLPGDWTYWEKNCRAFVAVCDEVVVLKLAGWMLSEGVKAEIEMAQELGKPVSYVEPE